jgi:hypothetical protein
LAKPEEILTKLNSGSPEENHTLRWDKNLPSATRFTVLAEFNHQAVLDKNTGLVWEQAPDTTLQTWWSATNYCINKVVGGTVGWRLPSVAELRSMLDLSLFAPFVPASIFTGVQLGDYWSATTFADFPNLAWSVRLGVSGGPVMGGDATDAFKTDSGSVWCVRGPMQESVY